MFRNLLAKNLLKTRTFLLSHNMNSYVSMNVLFNKHKRLFSTQNELSVLIEAVNKKDFAKIATIAIEQPKLIAEQTYNDNSALHEAARLGDIDAIKALQTSFNAHFNVNHKCHCYLKRTPMHYAVENNRYTATELLFELGADANITDEKNRTALDYACEAFSKGDNTFAAMIELISANGGKANQHKVEPMLLQIQESKHAQQFEAEYAMQENNLNQKMQEAKQKYMHDVTNRLTPGKK